MTERMLVAGELTERDRERFKRVQSDNVLIMSCMLDGVGRAVICDAYEAEDGDMIIYPLAMIMTDEEIGRVQDPYGETVE